jgi:DNA-binding transcriptional MerR regulator
MMAASAPRGRSGMSIGQVLQELKGEFPDVSISKLRFLEAEGLIQPQRSPSGYRRFSTEDVERLRYVLAAQRDHYYPLRVIKQHLDALARGLEPPMVAGQLPRVPSPGVPSDTIAASENTDESGGGEPQPRRPTLRLSSAELCENAGLTEEQLEQLIDFGLVTPFPGADFYGEDALAIAAAVTRLAKYGLEPRHLRTVKTAADREVGLIEHVIRPLRRARAEDARDSHEAAVAELTDLCLALHSSLMRAALAGGAATA